MEFNRRDQRPLAALGEPRNVPLQLVPLAQLLGGPFPRLSVTNEGNNAISAVSSYNSTNSPFLCLPLEVRHELYRIILGDRLIHFRLAMGHVSTRPWRHVVCQHKHLNDSKAQQDQSMTMNRRSEQWEPQHRRCMWETFYNPDTIGGSSYWDDERMHLTILRCCRQVYAEASEILWSTNTFSIHDLATLSQFFAERTAIQKESIRHLRLRFDMTQRFHVHHRRSLLNPALMHSLSGLRHLILILEEEFPAKLVQMMGLTGRSLTEFGGNRIDAGIERFSLLPLTKVEVEVLSYDSPNGEDGQEDDGLREAWKRDYATTIRDCLMGRHNEIELHE